MRVLLVNTLEKTGGAAIAAGRLMRALNRNGIEAEMLVREKVTTNPRVAELPQPKWLLKARFIAERLRVLAALGFKRNNLFAIDPATDGTDITGLDEFSRANVVHLHWINQAMLSLDDIRRILDTGKRTVWTMHDMWPFTGVCHQAGSCTRWMTGCGCCPLLGKRGGTNDMSAKVFRRKQQLLRSRRITFVGCSNWLTDLAKKSPILQGQRIESIPNPLDTVTFSPKSKREARSRLGLPQDKRIILFVAYKATDPNKGIGYLREAVARMCAERPQWCEKLAVVAVGREAAMLEGSMDAQVIGREYVSEQNTMIDLYNSADLLAMPTLMDNLPNTVAEAMACKTPCVAFEVGGLPQMIDHGTNGFLATYKDSASLAQKITALLDMPAQEYDIMAQAAREKAVKAYSEQNVAARFAEIYHP